MLRRRSISPRPPLPLISSALSFEWHLHITHTCENAISFASRSHDGCKRMNLTFLHIETSNLRYAIDILQHDTNRDCNSLINRALMAPIHSTFASCSVSRRSKNSNGGSCCRGNFTLTHRHDSELQVRLRTTN